MDPEDSHSESKAVRRPTDVEVCDKLMKYLADSLRDLPGQQRTFLYLPRFQVGTEWSRWLQNYDPMPQPGGWQFRFWYGFHPFGEWDAEHMCNRLSELWRIWGWDCSVDNESPSSSYRLTGSSPDSYELTFRARPQRQKSCIEIVSPIFSANATEPVSMPFAVTPFGPLALATAWALYPELIVW
jgi:hypothetical protein